VIEGEVVLGNNLVDCYFGSHGQTRKLAARLVNGDFLVFSTQDDLAKFFGVFLGKKEKHLPLGLKKRLSLHSYHWSSGARGRCR